MEPNLVGVRESAGYVYPKWWKTKRQIQEEEEEKRNDIDREPIAVKQWLTGRADIGPSPNVRQRIDMELQPVVKQSEEEEIEDENEELEEDDEDEQEEEEQEEKKLDPGMDEHGRKLIYLPEFELYTYRSLEEISL